MTSNISTALFIAILLPTQLAAATMSKPPIYELIGCTDSAHNFCKVISEHKGSKACETARKAYLAENPGNNALCNKKVVQ